MHYCLLIRRPGEMGYFTDAIEAHKDMHFRLLRHDLVAPIQFALIKFKESKGVKSLKVSMSSNYQ